MPTLTNKIEARSYLDSDLYEWVRQTAFAERISISEYIRRLVVAARMAHSTNGRLVDSGQDHNEEEEREMATQIWCDSCLEAGIHTPATTHSTNPEWSGYDLCEECAEEYNQRPPINSANAGNES